MTASVQFKWAIARHRSTTDQAKYILSLVNEGVGYYLLNKDRAKNEDVIVAFKRPYTGEILPHHLAFANPVQIERLERMEAKRKGIN